MEKSSESPFYIGWQPMAPLAYARRVRLCVVVLALVAAAVAALLVYNQGGFATSTFELGRPAVLEGQVLTRPFPRLRVSLGTTSRGEPLYKDILLVSFGKFGAEKAIAQYEERHGMLLHGRRASVEGALIYHDGRTLFELTKLAGAFRDVGEAPEAVSDSSTPAGRVALVGEIADPKCLLGVMKPGWGKPHRSCAVRCLAGGITPVLHARSTGGQSNYYLLLGPGEQPVNQELLAHVGKPVLVCGELERRGEWLVLRVDPRRGISPPPAGFQAGDLPMCRD